MMSRTCQSEQAVGASQAPGASAIANMRSASSRTTRRMVSFPSYVIAFHALIVGPLSWYERPGRPRGPPLARGAGSGAAGRGQAPHNSSHHEPQRTTRPRVNAFQFFGVKWAEAQPGQDGGRADGHGGETRPLRVDRSARVRSHRSVDEELQSR